MVKLTPEQDAHDIEVAKAVATRAESAACRIMAETVENECENPRQKLLASAIVTAAMIVKFGEANLAVPNDEWRKIVENMVAQLRPLAKEMALDVRFGKQS